MVLSPPPPFLNRPEIHFRGLSRGGGGVTIYIYIFLYVYIYICVSNMVF